MGKKIKITAGKVSMEAELNDTDTAQKIWEALPIQQKGNTWGYEIYFSIPVKAKEENAKEVVDLGDIEIGYGRTLKVENMLLSGKVEVMEFAVDYSDKVLELKEDNNRVEMKI